MSVKVESAAVAGDKSVQNFTKNPIEEYKLMEKITNEEYKIWKKTVPLLYETIQVHVLDRPSSVFQWIQGGVEVNKDQNSVTARFLLADEYLSKESESYIRIASVELPSTLLPNTKNTIPIPSGPPGHKKLKIISAIKHEEEINLLKVNKTNNKLASFLSSGDIVIYDLVNKFENLSIANRLKYHGKVGRALSWLPDAENTLISGSKDGSVAVWDTSKSNLPVRTFEEAHSDSVNGLSWNREYSSVFASVSDDISLKVFDTRNSESQPIYQVFNAHNDAINAVEFHPSASTLLATGSSDSLVSLWDLRYFERPFRTLFGTNGSITHLKFDDLHANMLSSVATDKRVYLWDLNEIDAGDFDDEIFSKDPDNEDPCLKFIHGGHISQINDYDFSHDLVNVYGSVGSDGMLEIWKPFLPEEEQEEEEEEEEEEQLQNGLEKDKKDSTDKQEASSNKDGQKDNDESRENKVDESRENKVDEKDNDESRESKVGEKDDDESKQNKVDEKDSDESKDQSSNDIDVVMKD